ncbi:MAG: membrane integrity-associated transporter subunit PqiC [Mailhella sp.]
MKNFLFLLLAAASLSGCTLPAQLKSSETVHYYILSSPMPQKLFSGKTAIGILPVSLPGYLSRQQIVLREADGVSIKVHEFDRWGENLSQGIGRVLSDTLTSRGIPALALHAGTKVTDKLLVDIRKFDGPLKGSLMLDAVWRIQRNGEVVTSGHIVKSSPAGESIAAMVEAQSLLIQELASDIAGTLQRGYTSRSL